MDAELSTALRDFSLTVYRRNASFGAHRAHIAGSNRSRTRGMRAIGLHSSAKLEVEEDACGPADRRAQRRRWSPRFDAIVSDQVPSGKSNRERVAAQRLVYPLRRPLRMDMQVRLIAVA
jgi:hypothetical protein